MNPWSSEKPRTFEKDRECMGTGNRPGIFNAAIRPMNPLLVRVKKVHERAVLPKYGSPYAAGADVSAVTDTTIPAQGRAVVDTGLVLDFLQKDVYARIAPRSGLAVNFGIDVLAGVVDADYRGSVKVVLYNTTTSEYKVSAGDRIAQIVFERIYQGVFKETSSVSETTRNQGGFGSTGV